MKVYIDYTTVIDVERRAGEYVGAGNFAREIISLMIDRHIDLRVIVCDKFTPKMGLEKDLLGRDGIIIKTNNIIHIDYSDCDVLFLPTANGYMLRNAQKIRKHNSNLKICAVVHDKQHNIPHFDKLDGVFYDGINGLSPVLFTRYCIKRMLYNYLYPEWIKSIDKVITVSNYSIQALNHKNIKRILYIYQGTSIDKEIPNLTDKYHDLGDYVLFVSGGRAEKNLARTLMAYYKFTKDVETDCKICITGLNDETLNCLIKNLKLSHDFIKKYIRVFDYVKTAELAYLYKNCRYVLFTSKAEGFGLPVLEAMRFGKTILASWQTSIPEVAGSILYYVNAYDVNSILTGMKYLAEDKNLKYREELVKKKMKIIDEQIELDKRVLIDEIISE